MKNQETITMDLTQKDFNSILLALGQQANKIKYHHNEHLKIDPEYDGPMMGQNLYDGFKRTIAKIERKLKINAK